MNIRKTILIVSVVFVAATTPPLLSREDSAPANNTSGKVQVLDNGESVLVEFRARGKRDDKPAGGSFRRSSADKSIDTYCNVVYVKVDGDYAWFAGKCVMDSDGLAGRWFFAAVHDGGRPSELVDHLWWDWLPRTPNAESIAADKVENIEKPDSNKPIESGNITVSFYD